VTLPRVVATDCDGTLLRSDGSVSDLTREVLGRVEEAGTTIVLVTARPPRWMDELADVVGGHGIALCGNGAFTYDVGARRVVSHRLMDVEVVRELAEDLRRELPQVSFALESVEGFAREEAFRRDSGRTDGEWFVGELASALQHAPGKMLVRHPTMAVDDLRERVARIVGARAEVSHSGAVGLAEIGAAGVTKGLALADWCAEQRIEADQVWAFGDAPNDLPMLTWAGRSYAVANAHPEVLDAVAGVGPSNDNDGVARTLEALLD
jgi:Cof subfamily protein (haloacid dehalogenase superfamily)